MNYIYTTHPADIQLHRIQAMFDRKSSNCQSSCSVKIVRQEHVDQARALYVARLGQSDPWNSTDYFLNGFSVKTTLPPVIMEVKNGSLQ